MKNQISVKVKLFAVSAAVAFVFATVFFVGTTTTLAGFKALNSKQGSQYAQSCAKCHGADGTSQTAKGKKTHATDLTKSRVSDAKGIKIIANGSGSMPGFKDNMTPDEIKALMNYVKGFRN